MLGKSRNAVFFNVLCVSAGSKSNLAKAAGAEVALYQNMSGSDHFLKLRCGKIARRCSEKHIFKSKCTKRVRFGPLFEVAMWKNCTPL